MSSLNVSADSTTSLPSASRQLLESVTLIADGALDEWDDEVVLEYFSVLVDFAPSLAANARVALDWLINIFDQSITPAIITDLAIAERAVRRSRVQP